MFSAVGIAVLQGGEDVKDGMHIKRLAFLDLIKEEAEKNAEHADEQFDADFAIMAGELARTISSVINALGGEVEEQHES